MEKQANFRNKTRAIRVTAEENKLFEALAKEQGITMSEFLRTAGLTLAEMSIENREFLKSLGKEGPEAFQNIRVMLESLKETLANSIQGSNSLLSHKIDQIEKLIGAFIYAYLFHTPEVKTEQKQQARESALARKKKVLEIVAQYNSKEQS